MKKASKAIQRKQIRDIWDEEYRRADALDALKAYKSAYGKFSVFDDVSDIPKPIEIDSGPKYYVSKAKNWDITQEPKRQSGLGSLVGNENPPKPKTEEDLFPEKPIGKEIGRDGMFIYFLDDDGSTVRRYDSKSGIRDDSMELKLFEGNKLYKVRNVKVKGIDRPMKIKRLFGEFLGNKFLSEEDKEKIKEYQKEEGIKAIDTEQVIKPTRPKIGKIVLTGKRPEGGPKLKLSLKK